MVAVSLDFNFKEELSAVEHSRSVFFFTVLQLEQIVDLVPALLSPAVGGSMQSQVEAKFRHEPLVVSIRLELLLPFPDSANSVRKPSHAAATLAQQGAKIKAASNAVHRISAPALASSAAERVFPSQSTDLSLSGNRAFRSSRPNRGASLDGLSPGMGDSWASMVNTPLLPIFQKSSTANNDATGHGQTGDLAAAKLNNLFGSGNVPRLGGLEKSSAGSVVPQLPLRAAAVAACGMAVAAVIGHFSGSEDGGSVMAAANHKLRSLWAASRGLQSGIGLRDGPGRQRQHEERRRRFRPGVASHAQTAQVHAEFRGMSWKDMAVMDEQALEAQGVAALGARRKMLKTFEFVGRKMGIDDPTAPPLHAAIG
ncbi:hypothetical protein V8E53_011568 [Lactarius tabidus]